MEYMKEIIEKYKGKTFEITADEMGFIKSIYNHSGKIQIFINDISEIGNIGIEFLYEILMDKPDSKLSELGIQIKYNILGKIELFYKIINSEKKEINDYYSQKTNRIIRESKSYFD